MTKARVEYLPESGRFPHVVVVPREGGEVWFSFATRAEAEEKLPLIVTEMDRPDGLIHINPAQVLFVSESEFMVACAFPHCGGRGAHVNARGMAKPASRCGCYQTAEHIRAQSKAACAQLAGVPVSPLR